MKGYLEHVCDINCGITIQFYSSMILVKVCSVLLFKYMFLLGAQWQNNRIYLNCFCCWNGFFRVVWLFGERNEIQINTSLTGAIPDL